MEGQQVVNIVLDGAVCVGKSVLMYRFMTGKYEIVGATIGAAHYAQNVMINQVKYDAQIWDTNGLVRLLLDLNALYCRGADVIVEFFAIDRLRSLEETILLRIPYFRRKFPQVPILLVGAKADLRGAKEAYLFPVELGPVLARCTGAVKYMECSSKGNINVHEVFEEAVRCSLSKSHFSSEVHQNLEQKEEQTANQIISEFYSLAYKDVFKFGVFEIDRLQLSKAFPGTFFSSLVERSPTCSLWYEHGCTTDQTQVLEFRIFSVAESHKNVVCSKCPPNLRFFAIQCKSIARFLDSARDRMKVRGLVIVNCTGSLDFSFLAKLTGLEYLIIINTNVNLATLTFPPHLHETMKHLELNNCGITQATDVPIGNLVNLQILNLANLRFFANECKYVVRFLLSISDQMKVRSLAIVNCSGTLDFSFLDNFTGLEYLIIVDTNIDLATLTFPPHLRETMKHLELNNCGITQVADVPSEIGNLVNLEILNLANNNFKKIPTTLSFLYQLHTLLIDQDNVSFPPPKVLKRSARDVINYLGAVKEYPVNNTESKVIVVGQEGVGKSTLVKAMKKGSWRFSKNEPPPKTDGVDISVLSLKDIQCKVFDLAGDVEYLNTHSLFLSSNTLHLVVYDLSQVVVDKGARSADHLCRLELWLETIASQDPKAKVILVGTHADHPLVNREILNKNRKVLADVLIKHYPLHRASCKTDSCTECFICNPGNCPENLEGLKTLVTDITTQEQSSASSKQHSSALNTTTSQIPHVLGYFEVSSIKKYPSTIVDFRNINLAKLKSLASSSISKIMDTTGTALIPKQWLSFRQSIAQKLLSDDNLKEQPLMPLSKVHDIAMELEIHREERVIAMLRFFHCQGTYLWYEDLPEMKDIVILDPLWLSDQLRTLISHRSSVSSICDGVLRRSELSTIWHQMSEENRQKLLSLFRSVGLCFSISDREELFPCSLPVGWPDREIWPPVPNRGQNQTSLLFKFSFIPPSFFPDLIAEVNKKKDTFARNVKPLYYRFHIVYIRRDPQILMSSLDNAVAGGAAKDNDAHSATEDDDFGLRTQDSYVLHTIHYEVEPYNNSLTVAVRGPDPPSIIPDIKSTIDTVQRRRYPGITYDENLLCPECVIKRVQPPASFRCDIPYDGVCSRGHIVGTNQSIFHGRYSSAEIVPSTIGQTGRVVNEILEDHFCPKLFVVLPINVESLSLKDRFVYSYIRDGFAVHLLCECPGLWHFVDSPGFRVGKPKEFFKKYGSRVCKVLRFISTLSTPMKAATSLDPHCKIGAAVGAGAKSASKELQSLLDSYLEDYPHLKPTLGSPDDDLMDLESCSGLQRSELCRFLEVEAKGRNFGPLVCTYVDKRGELLWLCEEHSKMFTIVRRRFSR